MRLQAGILAHSSECITHSTVTDSNIAFRSPCGPWRHLLHPCTSTVYSCGNSVGIRPPSLWPTHVKQGPTSLQTVPKSGLLWSAYVKEHRKVDRAALAFKNRRETTAFSSAEACLVCYLQSQDCGLCRASVSTFFETLFRTFLIIFFTFLLKLQWTRHGCSPAFRKIMPHRNLSDVLLSSSPGTIDSVGDRYSSRNP